MLPKLFPRVKSEPETIKNFPDSNKTINDCNSTVLLQSRKICIVGALINIAILQIYNAINDKCVGLLIRARKRDLLHFDGEMLYQRRDDHKWIQLTRYPRVNNPQSQSTGRLWLIFSNPQNDFLVSAYCQRINKHGLIDYRSIIDYRKPMIVNRLEFSKPISAKTHAYQQIPVQELDPYDTNHISTSRQKYQHHQSILWPRHTT